ncbi:hypothetical protein [Pantoea ananatis]|nr:hypothetical protein [Pantoea ananatis]PKC47987.1 hypothetical protein V461_00995 [Pantoea ananatis BRT98]
MIAIADVHEKVQLLESTEAAQRFDDILAIAHGEVASVANSVTF